MTAEPALVIATYSRRMGLRLPGGEEVDARIKGKRLRPVCGDRVEAAHAGPRRVLCWRLRGETKMGDDQARSPTGARQSSDASKSGPLA